MRRTFLFYAADFAFLGEFFHPPLSVGVKLVESDGGISAAIFNVFASKPLDENVDFHVHELSVYDLSVLVAKFQKLSGNHARELFCGKQEVVRTAKQTIVFIVLSYIIEKHVHELLGVFGGQKARVIEECVDKLVFKILRDGINIVVMGIERAAANVGALAKLADVNFVKLLFFAKHFGELLFYELSCFP